jgi:hypothetical protein
MAETTSKKLHTFNMSVHRDTADKKVTGWRLKSSRVGFPVRDLEVGVSECSFTKTDYPHAFASYEDDLGITVPNEFYKFVTFSGRTESSARFGMVDFFKTKLPETKLKMKRNWSLSVYEQEDEDSDVNVTNIFDFSDDEW